MVWIKIVLNRFKPYLILKELLELIFLEIKWQRLVYRLLIKTLIIFNGLSNIYTNISISRNHWIKEIPSLGSLVSSIRTNVKLFHLCLDVQDERLLKQLVNYIKIKTNIKYLLNN